jgi:hypothetical protein
MGLKTTVKITITTVPFFNGVDGGVVDDPV